MYTLMHIRAHADAQIYTHTYSYKSKACILYVKTHTLTIANAYTNYI